MKYGDAAMAGGMADITKWDSSYLYGGRYFCPEATGERSLVSHNAAARLLDTVEDGLLVPGKDGDEIDDLATHAQFLLGHLGHLPEDVDLGAPAHQGHVRAWKKNRRKMSNFVEQNSFLTACSTNDQLYRS